MLRPLPGLLATLLAVSVVHCASAEVRDTFDPEEGGSATTSSGAPSEPSGPPAIDSDSGVTDGGSQVCTEDIDVVLVIDTSSSMNFVLQALEEEFVNVVQASNALKQGAHFGAVFFQDNALLDVSGDEEGGKVHLGHESLVSAFSTMRTVYTRNNRNPGDGPTGPSTQNPICEENSLDALHLAATDFPWRENAARVAVVVTDDTFLEADDNYGDRDGDGDTTSTSYPREGDYPAQFTLAQTVTALQTAGVKVFSFTQAGASFECGTGRRHDSGDSVTYGWSAPYEGQAPIPEQTGGKNYDLAEIRSGSLHLDEAINGIVLETRCNGVN